MLKQLEHDRKGEDFDGSWELRVEKVNYFYGVKL